MRDVSECWVYVEHLASEHRRLHDVVGQVEKQLRDKGAAGSDADFDLAASLQALRDELSRHFVEEEQGGCLEEAVARCPSVAEEVTALEDQHPRFLDELDDLIERVRRYPARAAAALVAPDFGVFAQRLHKHEAAEHRVLQLAFGTNLHGESET